jgi:hypothetical protein
MMISNTSLFFYWGRWLGGAGMHRAVAASRLCQGGAASKNNDEVRILKHSENFECNIENFDYNNDNFDYNNDNFEP